MNTFGSRLRGLREARSWSQERLAFEMEVTGATISKWENDRAEPNLGHLARLRQVFDPEGTSLDWLVCATGPQAGQPGTTVLREPGASYVSSPRMAQDDEEAAVLARFRELPAKRRRALLLLLND